MAQTYGTTTLPTQSARHSRYDQLFDGQLETLERRGAPKNLLELLAVKKTAVLTSAANVRMRHDRPDVVPFIPVIPPSLLSSVQQMQLVVSFTGKTGTTDFNPKMLIPEVGAMVPSTPYYLVRPTDGDTICGMPPSVAADGIANQGRWVMNLYEIIALCTHTSVLTRHGVVAAKSRYRLVAPPGEKAVPAIYLNGPYKEPLLRWHFLNRSNSQVGTPAYRNRVL